MGEREWVIILYIQSYGDLGVQHDMGGLHLSPYQSHISQRNLPANWPVGGKKEECFQPP